MRPPRRADDSRLELALFFIAMLVMLADAAITVMQFVGDCESLVGMFIWMPVLAVWIVAVLLPAGWRAWRGRLGRPLALALVGSTVLTALPALLATVMNHPHLQHCIS